MSIQQLIEKAQGKNAVTTQHDRPKFEATWTDFQTIENTDKASPGGDLIVIIRKSNHYPVPRYRLSIGTSRNGRVMYGSINTFNKITEGGVEFISDVKAAIDMLNTAHEIIKEDVEIEAKANARGLAKIQRKEGDKEFGPGGSKFGQDPRDGGKVARKTGKTARNRARKAGKFVQE